MWQKEITNADTKSRYSAMTGAETWQYCVGGEENEKVGKSLKRIVL